MGGTAQRSARQEEEAAAVAVAGSLPPALSVFVSPLFCGRAGSEFQTFEENQFSRIIS
jgi:hypothetical protein